MANQNPAHIVTGQCRLSYCNLTQPRANPNGGDPRYGVTVLLPKSDTATKQKIDAAMEAAAQAGVAKLWNGQRPPIVSLPVYDGDGVRPSDGSPFGEECRGHWVFTASTKTAPAIVDTNLNPILQPTELYSGIYGRVGVTFFPYFQQGKKGVGCALDNVQKLADGEPLSGRATAADDFGAGQGAAAYSPVVAAPGYPGQAPYHPQAPQGYAPQASTMPAQPPAIPGALPGAPGPVSPQAPVGYPAQAAPSYPGQAPYHPQAPQGYAPQAPEAPVAGQPTGGIYMG